MENSTNTGYDKEPRTRFAVMLPFVVGIFTTLLAFFLIRLIGLDMLPAICSAVAVGFIAALLLPERPRVALER